MREYNAMRTACQPPVFNQFHSINTDQLQNNAKRYTAARKILGYKIYLFSRNWMLFAALVFCLIILL